MEFEPEIQDLINRFENTINQGIVQYYDTDDLETIIDCYITINQYDKAHIALDYAYRIHPNSDKIKCAEAKIHLLEERYADAIEILETIRNLEPDYIAILAECYIHTFKFNKAKSLFLQYLTICNTKELAAIFTDIASLFNLYKQSNTALEFIDNGLALFPDDNNLLVEKAISLDELEQYAKAETILSKVINANPYQHEVWGLLGSLQFRQNKITEALGSYEYALAINPNDEQAKLQHAHCLFNLGRYNDAIEPYKEFVEKHPDDDMVLTFLAETYENLNQWDKALPIYQKVLELNNSMPVGWIGCACCLHNMNEIADAYEIIDEAEKKFPDTIEVIYYRALIERDIAFSKKDDSFLNLAVHHFMQCLKMAPDNPAICYETGMILTQIADYEKALPLLLKAYDLNPSFDRIQILLAVANYGVGNKKIAYEHLNLARSTMSDTADDIFFTIFPNISPFEEV